MSESGSAVPSGYHSVTPHMVVRNAAEAIDFYRKAFGAEEVMRLVAPDGNGIVHAELTIEGSRVMLADENPDMGAQSPLSLGGTAVTLHVYVADVDAAVDKAAAAGCQVVMPPADMFWGDRYAQLSDPYGHSWAMATHQRDVSNDELKAGMEAFFQS